jgi:hypothetical protein
MGIEEVDHDKTRRFQITGPFGSGKTAAVHFGGVLVEAADGVKEFFCRRQGAPSETAEKKAGGPYPKSHEIKVNADFPGPEGDFFVQGVIRLENRITAGEQGGPVLQKKKIAEN